jgi:hypothetical protein
MKLHILLLALSFPGPFLLSSASAITADQLAGFLGVSDWRTVIDLPAEAHTIELWEVRDGEPTERLLVSQPEWTKRPEAGIAVIVGPRDGNYRITISFSSGGTLGVVTKIPLFTQTVSVPLPPKIQEGDFALFGTSRQGAMTQGTDGAKSLAKGFLLRVRKS